MSDDRRLIEDFLPIQAISAEASREKSVRKGHISTLHLWWARRPLVACRAAVYGALVPASRFIPENGPDNKKQSLGRANAAKFIERLCKYPGNPTVIKEAQRHILEAHAERLTIDTGKKVTVEDIEEGRAPRPKVLDMFAGGGAIPLEALRLGCEAYALDLNPVAHIIQLCTLVYPQKYGKPDPNARGMTGPSKVWQAGSPPSTTWGGLADEVRYWGEWVLKKVKAEIGDLYPLIPDPEYKKERGRTGVPPVIQGELFQARRHLPHWQIGNSVYFITFSTKKIELPAICRKIILDACHFWDGKKIRLHLVCVMPDHVHALIEPLEETPGVYHDLSKILHSIKSFTVHEINKMMGRSGPLWEEESWDRIIRDVKDYYEKWQYILNNPVKVGLSKSPEQYAFLYANEEVAGKITEAINKTGETPVIPPPGYLMPVAYLWTRTVRCKNPSCGATVPLVKQTWLCKKKGRYAALKANTAKGEKKVSFEVVEGTTEKELGFDPTAGSKGGNATCPFCGTVADSDYVKAEGCANRMGRQFLAIAATKKGTSGKIYLSEDSLPEGFLLDDDETLSRLNTLLNSVGIAPLDETIEINPRSMDIDRAGFSIWGQIFTYRQQIALISLCAAVKSVTHEMSIASCGTDHIRAVVSMLGCGVSKFSDFCWFLAVSSG